CAAQVFSREQDLFFQAEDGIRDRNVTGVQTCALPICAIYDATARIIASLLERELKQPISVVNRTGGSGVVGHQAIASSPADGYTLGMITVEITMMHWVGLTPLTYKDYTPVGLVNADPAGIHVRVDSPYKS